MICDITQRRQQHARMKLLILSTIGQAPNGMPLDKIWFLQVYQESIQRLGLDLLLLGGKDLRWENNRQGKIDYLYSQLDQIDQQYTHILASDAFDVFFVASTQEIVQKFEASGARLLIASEMVFHPKNDNLLKHFESVEDPTRRKLQYRFLNAGGMIARRQDYIDTIRYLYENKEKFIQQQCEFELGGRTGISEQCFWQQAYCAGDCGIAIDHQCSIFQTFGMPNVHSVDFKPYMNQERRVTFVPELKRFENNVTGERPCHMHYNGKHKKPFGRHYRQWYPDSPLYAHLDALRKK